MTCLVLPENLSIEALPALVKQEGWLKQTVDELDFAEVQKADSAILSLVLFWAQQQGTPLKLKNLPHDLQTLVELYDLHSVVNPD